jgi:hypothetical protein
MIGLPGTVLVGAGSGHPREAPKRETKRPVECVWKAW